MKRFCGVEEKQLAQQSAEFRSWTSLKAVYTSIFMLNLC